MTADLPGTRLISRGRRLLYLRLPPEWGLIASLTSYLQSFLSVSLDATIAQCASLVAHELLENAVKYAIAGTEIQIELTDADSRKVLEIVVTNKIVDSRLQILQKELQRIGSLTPGEAFQDALRRARRRPQGQSMLGLARVQHEGSATIHLHRIDHETIAIRALICP